MVELADDCVALAGEAATGAAGTVVLLDDGATGAAAGVLLPDDEAPDVAAGVLLPDDEVPDAAGAVGAGEAVKPPPDTDVGVGVIALVWSIARATFHWLRRTVFVPSFGTTNALMSLSRLLTRDSCSARPEVAPTVDATCVDRPVIDEVTASAAERS